MPAPNMSSHLETTSAILGEYMLKGWTLTDLHCENCRVTPLMREPASVAQREGREVVQFCALCDGGPSGRGSGSTSTSIAPPATSSVPSQLTPTPEYSSGLAASSSRTDCPDRAPAPSQADDAASQISALLLQGYSLLGDNCPNPSCRGIPLVGFPRKTDGSKDGRRMCVSCERGWVLQGDVRGMTLVPVPDATPFADASSPAAAGEMGGRIERGKQASENGIGAESPRSKRRRELYEVGTMMNDEAGSKAGVASAGGENAERWGAEGEVEVNMDPEVSETPLGRNSHGDVPSPLSSALRTASFSLASTLDRLAASLSAHTSGARASDESRYFVDVKLHTEAMRDVLDVLQRVEGFGKGARGLGRSP